MKWVNPACYFNKVPGDRGMGLSISVNDHTRKTFGNPERFEKLRDANDRKFPGLEARFSGQLLISGTFIVTNANSQTYSGYIESNLGVLGDEQREKNINEHEVFKQPLVFVNKTSWSPEIDPYAFPWVWNKMFYDEKGKIIRVYVNEFDEPVNLTKEEFDQAIEDGKDVKEMDISLLRYSHMFSSGVYGLVNHKDNETGLIKTVNSEWFFNYSNQDYDSFKTFVVSPFFYVSYVLKQILRNNHFFIKNSYVDTDPDWKLLILFNNYDITPLSYQMGTVEINVPAVDINSNVITSLPSYSWKGKTVISLKREEANGVNILPKNHLPKISLKDYILSIQNLTNSCYHFKADNSVDNIDREAILKGEAFDLDKYFIKDWVIGDKKDLALKFTMKHDDNDNVFADGYTDLDDRRDDIKGSVDYFDKLDDINDPEVGDIYFCKLENIYVEYKYVSETTTDPLDGQEREYDILGWKEISIGFQNAYYNYGKDEEEEIPINFSTLQTKNLFLPVAYAEQQGNVAGIKNVFTDFSPRVFFDNSSNQTNNISLDLGNDSKGIIAKRYKLWAPFWANRLEVEGELDLPLNILLYIRDHITKKYRTRQGEFIFEYMECTFQGNKMSTTTFPGFKVE